MMALLQVGIGGALGACARFGVGRLTATVARAGSFPLATLLVNVVGCFAIGWIATHMDLREDTTLWRSLVVVGFLGGFTTFSAFGLENVQLMQRGATGLALLNIALQVCLGLAAVWAGMALAR